MARQPDDDAPPNGRGVTPPFVSAIERASRGIEAVQRHPWRVAAIAVLIVVVSAAAWRVLDVPAPAAPEVRLPMATRSAEPATSDSPSSSRGADVVVHVAGAVARAGVYRLSDGARTVDAIGAAGGARADADLARVNLAARLSDGLRVYVPAVGEATVPPLEGQDAVPGGGPINLNAATAEQLDDLPGIGPSTAAAIIAHRRDHGPFQSIDQLLDVRGIGAAKLEQIRPFLVV